jgi:signal transduction histidine kinase/FixJ family two-component response regulator
MSSPGLTPSPEDRIPLHVLLVEDNADDAFLLERHLLKNGFAPRIVRVETAEELLAEFARADKPDLILADYNLPTFSGPEALQIVKSTGLDIPFIMLSGVMSETTAVESMRAGAQDYVTKQNLSRLVPAVERELKEAEDRRKKLAAELALQASEDRFHRLVEAMPLGLLITDAGGDIVYTNIAAKRLFCLDRAGCLDDPHAIKLDHLFPDLKPEVFFNALIPLQEPFEATCRALPAPGEPAQSIDVLVGVALLNPDAAPEHRQLAAFVADLTLQKKSEEMLRRTEKLAVAGRLAASIAHEINNPLEAVTNLLYLVGRTELTDDARNYLELASHELDRVAQITVQTLRFHRRSSKPVETDLADLVESVLPLFQSRTRLLHAVVESRFRPSPKVLIHDGEIRQVIANLISNATDALGEGGKLVLRLAPARHGHTGISGVMLTVADSGHGMSPEVLARIYEPFFSTKGATGTGLGLWVSLEIVEKHGGTLRVRSRVARPQQPGGTVFRLFLPLTHSFSAVEQREENPLS